MRLGEAQLPLVHQHDRSLEEEPEHPQPPEDPARTSTQEEVEVGEDGDEVVHEVDVENRVLARHPLTA